MNVIILKGMAKAFFASAYADLHGEIMDQLPEAIDPAAIHAARTLYMQMESSLKGKLDGLWAYRNGISMMDDHELFGHYAAMQAMGHGVGLLDFNVHDSITDAVPYIEFGSHSLEKDYEL